MGVGVGKGERRMDMSLIARGKRVETTMRRMEAALTAPGRETASGRTRRRGMTLVEVLVALTVLAAVMVGTYRLIVVLARLRQSAHNHYTAVVIANNRIERARNTIFADLPLLAEERVPVAASGAPSADGPFFRTTRIQTNYGGNPKLVRVIVTVEVPRLLRRDEARPSETLTTLLTEYVEP